MVSGCHCSCSAPGQDPQGPSSMPTGVSGVIGAEGEAHTGLQAGWSDLANINTGHPVKSETGSMSNTLLCVFHRL